MKRIAVAAGLASLVLGACAVGSNSKTAAPLLDGPSPAPADLAIAQRVVTTAMQRLGQGPGVTLQGTSFISNEGTDVPTQVSGAIAADGSMELRVGVVFDKGTDTFVVRSLRGHEYTFDPQSRTWNVATLGEPAASGISALDPLQMAYPAHMTEDSVRIQPDDVLNGYPVLVYDIAERSSDGNDQVTTRLWISKETGDVVQEGVALSNQVALPHGLGFTGRFLLQFQPAGSPVAISVPIA